MDKKHPRYGPADSLASPRFSGIRTYARLPHLTDLGEVDVAIVGVPFDTGGTYRVGARFGPQAIRAASALIRPYHTGSGVAVFDSLSVVDYGDVPEVPREMGMQVIAGVEAHELGMAEVAKRVVERAGDVKVFLSFDIDFIDPAYAPATGTPEIGGFTTWESQSLLRGLSGLNYVGFDVVEVIPAYDVAENTSFTAANIVFEFLALLARARA